MWILLLPLLLILGYPFKLHFESLALDEPVVIFTSNPWRATLWTASSLGLAGLILAVAFRLAQQPDVGYALLGALVVALPGLALGFILLRLHLSYSEHDQYASLTVSRQEQRAEYYNKGVYLNFALTDVVHVTEYATLSRAPWSHYSYQVFFLQDGTQLLITCLFYSLLGPQELFATASHDTVTRYICWLPVNEVHNQPL